MLRHFQEGDLERIQLQEEQKREGREGWCAFYNKDTLVFEDEDRVLAIVLPAFEEGGRIVLYALISADCGDKAVVMFKKMKRIIDGWIDSDGINRVELTAQASFRQANRLAKMLGFECEGTMKKWFNGIDFNLWGRVK